MPHSTFDAWAWMEEQSAGATERGLQTLLIEVVAQLEAAMESQGLSRAEVARRAGVKREYVSRILSNPSNVTLATLVRLSNAVSHRLSIEIVPEPVLTALRAEAARESTG